MPITPQKVKKECSNCIIPDKLPTYCRQPGNLCNKWIFKKARCHFCTNLRACFELGKTVAKDHVCINFSKRKKPWNDKVWSFIAASLESDDTGPVLTPKGFRKSTPDESDEPGGDNFNPVELVENIINSDFDPRALALVDDRDIPKATNPLIFLTDKKFMGVDLFPRQLQLFSNLWAAFCPWCSNTKWLRNDIEVDTPKGEIWDRMVLLQNGVCPKCKRTKYEAVQQGLHNFYGTFVACAGQRSGKSISTGMVAAVHTYQYLTMPDIHSTFGLLPSTVLHGTFVGLRWSDAHDNLWEPYYDLVTNTPWFKDYLEFMKVESNRLGMELVHVKGESIAWKYKRMAWYPAGPDKRKLRGRCLHGSVLVSTSKGLIKASKGQDLIGSTVRKATTDSPITGHIKQEYKKEILCTYLDNGIRLDASTDHRIPIFKSESVKLRDNEDILGSYVLCQLGGQFPEKLSLDSKAFEFRPTYVQVIEYISDGHTWTMEEVASKFNCHVNSVRSHHLREVIKAGCIDVTQYRDDKGRSLPADYRVNTKFNLNDWNKPRAEGKIGKNRKGLTIPDYMTPELGRLIGYLLADGWINGYTYQFWTTSKPKYDDFNRIFKKIFGCKVYKRRDESGYGPDGSHPCYISEFSYTSITGFLDYLGVSGATAAAKTIPWCILEAPREVVIECVSAMFSCDGGIINRSDHVGFYYSSKSRKLIRQLQQVMHRLGYYCTITGEYLKVTRFHSLKFLQEYTGLNKRQWHEDTPIDAAWSQRGYTKFRIPGTECYVYSELNRKFNISVPKHLRQWVDSDIVFAKVTKQVNKGLRTVYDIEINSEDHLFPANGVLVHNTRIFAAGDEVGWFFGSEGGIKFNFDEIHKALSNSLMTIRPEARKLLKEIPDIPNAVDCYISSPSSKLDPIMRMYKQSRGSKTTLGWKGPTWEFNPRIKRDDPDLLDSYRKDSVAAERDFGANPPFSTDPYIKSPASLIAAIQTQKNCAVTKGLVTTADSLGGSVQYNKIHIRSYTDAPAILSIDAGYNHDSFALTVSHWIKTDEGRKLFTSALIELIPDPNPINFPGVYKEIIVPVLEAFNIKMVTFDRWQSINLRQTIFQEYKIDCLQYSVTYRDFDAIRDRIYAGEYLIPAPESPVEELLELDKNLDILIDRKPVNHFIIQMLSSKDTGRIVTKGDETTDDLLRSAILGLSVMLMPEYEKIFSGEGTINRRWTDKTLGSGLARSMSYTGTGFSTSIPGIASGGSSNILGSR